jgi:glutamyl-Q tRNA(Asp) synthetase
LSSHPRYIGRFAPSPSGPLHRGSLASAMASYLDAQAHQGKWLLRIEDIDTARSRSDASQKIISDLARLGFQFEPEPWFQSQRLARYQLAFEKLQKFKLVYPCICSRKEIEDSRTLSVNPAIYPGTCRRFFHEGIEPDPKTIRAWRLKLESQKIAWKDGDWLKASHSTDFSSTPDQASKLAYEEEIAESVGDFVLARPSAAQTPSLPPHQAVIEWTYQLSVVVDDEESGVTHVVRGRDLLESTSRQIYLQNLLGYRRLRYWHCPLVFGTDGQKLSKQNGALAINVEQALETLNQALRDLGLQGIEDSQLPQLTLAEFWESAIKQWEMQMLSP